MSSRFTPSPDAISRELQGEILILDLKTSQYFGLTGTGARLWQLVEQGTPVDEMLVLLEGEFDGDPAVIKEEACRFLDDLAARGLLIPASS